MGRVLHAAVAGWSTHLGSPQCRHLQIFLEGWSMSPEKTRLLPSGKGLDADISRAKVGKRAEILGVNL